MAMLGAIGTRIVQWRMSKLKHVNATTGMPRAACGHLLLHLTPFRYPATRPQRNTTEAKSLPAQALTAQKRGGSHVADWAPRVEL